MLLLLPAENNNPHLQWTLLARRKHLDAPSTSGPCLHEDHVPADDELAVL